MILLPQSLNTAGVTGMSHHTGSYLKSDSDFLLGVGRRKTPNWQRKGAPGTHVKAGQWGIQNARTSRDLRCPEALSLGDRKGTEGRRKKMRPELRGTQDKMLVREESWQE